jgi:magnesium transporter
MEDSSARAADAMVRVYLQKYPDEAARQLESRSVGEVARLLEEQSVVLAVAVVDLLTPDMAARVLEAMSDEAGASILERMEPNRSAVLLSRLDEAPRNRLLTQTDARLSRELEELLTYPPDSAGSLMDARVTTFRPEMRVDTVLSRLRQFPRKRIQEVYVVDEAGRLMGAVPIGELATSRPKDRLQQLYRPVSVFVQPMASREEVVEVLTQYRTTALPVADHDRRLLGIIRPDALMTATAEELSADIQTMVGVSKEERALSKVSFAVRKRLPWLEINLGTAFLAAAVVGLFEDTIARFTALAVLLPVVAGQSGNTGAQALAVVMRGLALREVRVRHWRRLLTKEVSVGFMNGIVVALTTSFCVYLWSRSVGLALVIGLSMVASMAIAGLSGAAIPLLLTALRQDPAQSSSIVLTTVTDVAGFFSFLGIATLLSGML